jgi:hypothetical protein
LIIGSSHLQRPFFNRESLSFLSSLRTDAFLLLVVVGFELTLTLDVVLAIEVELPMDAVALTGGGLLGPTEGVLALKSRDIGGRVDVVEAGRFSGLLTDGVLL